MNRAPLRWSRRLACCALLLGTLASAARADVWGFVDARGVAHFASERIDERYEIFFRGGESFDTRQTSRMAESVPAAQGLQGPTAPPKLIAFFEVSPSYKLLKMHLREASKVHNIDYELLQALIATESGFDTEAVSVKGAVGLMQLMPDTARRYGLEGDHKLPLEKKLTDPKLNIKTGARYLRDLINMFPGQLDLALAAYNAGEGAVQRAGNKIPNYKETQNYVRTVLQLYGALKPPPALADARPVPLRVRMELVGGARNRGNMVAPLAPAKADASAEH